VILLDLKPFVFIYICNYRFQSVYEEVLATHKGPRNVALLFNTWLSLLPLLHETMFPSRSRKSSLISDLLHALGSVLDLLSSSRGFDEKKQSNSRSQPQEYIAGAGGICHDSTFKPLRVVVESIPPPLPQSTEQQTRQANDELRKQNAERRERLALRIQTLIAFFTAFLLLANLWLAWTTSDSVKLQRQQIAGALGASIVLDGPWIPTIGDDLDYLKTSGLGITAKNSGKVRAKEVQAEFTMIRESLPSFSPIGTVETQKDTKSEIRPPEQTSGQSFNDALVLRFNADIFTSDDLHLIHTMKETIEISGWTKYDDGFNNQSGNTYCFDYIAGVPMHTFKDAGVSGTPNDKGQWIPCREARQTVKSALRWQTEGR
jgi:hypothetical protein